MPNEGQMECASSDLDESKIKIMAHEPDGVDATPLSAGRSSPRQDYEAERLLFLLFPLMQCVFCSLPFDGCKSTHLVPYIHRYSGAPIIAFKIFSSNACAVNN